MVKGARLVLPALALVTGAGCDMVAGLDRDFYQAQPGGSGGGGNGGAGGAGGAACALTTPPAPPASSPGGGDLDFTAAILSVDLGDLEDGIQFGFDLDGVCTGPDGEPASCAPPVLADKTGDGPGGIDNGVDFVFTQVSKVAGSPLNSTTIKGDAFAGRWSLLLRVRGYNGQPDDDQVSLAAYTTPGTRYMNGPAPAWMGSDAWPILESALLAPSDLEQPAFTDAAAYVSGGVLVARLARLPIQLRGAAYELTITLSDAALAATLEPAAAGSGYRFKDGTIAGTWQSADVFAGLSGFRLLGDPICTDEGDYTTIKSTFCSVVDLRAGGGAPGDPCDAVSFGMRFSAEPALLGAPVVDPAPSPGCPPETDPANDSCGG